MFISSNILAALILIFPIFLFVLMLIPAYKIVLIKKISLYFTLCIFLGSLFLWILFNNENNNFIFIWCNSWMSMFNIYYSLGLDGVSIFFIILTTFLTPFCILISWNSVKYRVKEFLILLLLTEFLLLNVFSVLDLFLFYVFFEGVLIPMFIIIGVWGARQRKIHAAYQFFFYTLTGSILMLLGIVIIYSQLGTTDIQILSNSSFTVNRQLFLWLAFFASFSIKIPMLPVHIWLPEAHVEAPTAGSVILAGILLKLGTYGIIRFMLPLFPLANKYFTPLVLTGCVIGIIYSSCTTIRQIDLKKIIAYSSVAHMNFALLGLFTNNSLGIEGCLYLMLAHGIVSSALFLSVGVLYDRYHTRNILYYGGLAATMPIFSTFLFIFTLANIGVPGTVNFIGEILILLGIFKYNIIVGLLAGSSIVLSAIYSIWLYNRLMFGQIRNNSLLYFADLSRREFNILTPLIIFTFILGIYPGIIIDALSISVNNYIV